MNFTASEKASTIRQPSTANLMVDSMDRDFTKDPSPWNFFINKPNSILNGYFTRIGTTEVVLEWNLPNISADLANNTVFIDVSGAGSQTITLPEGSYTVDEALIEIASLANTAFVGSVFQVAQVGQQASLDLSGNSFYVSGQLALQLGLPIGQLSTRQIVSSPDLRPFRYLDFVAPNLTANQELKDATTKNTQTSGFDVLCRWYMSWDSPVEYDTLGFPILMGYRRFTCRRLFSPPKQIKWDTAVPIGQLAFQVYGYGKSGTAYQSGVLLSDLYPGLVDNLYTNWLMTLQVSEV